MAISYIYTGEPMTGTANDDFVIAYKGSTGTDNNTVNGNNGDDLVIGDSSDTWIPGASYLNGSIATAFNLETLTSTWTTAENEMFGDWTIPHTTVMAESTIGQSEYFRIAIGAGQQIIIDLDFASNTAIGNTRDLVVELQDSLGNVISSADDSLVTDGGRGSFPSSAGSASSYDPYLVYTAATGGIYYINVRPFGSGPGSTFEDNNTFVMNISVGGHAVAATNPVQGADTLNGGEGDDALFGQGGADVINGGNGNDFIDSGSAGDIVHGDGGDDTLYGGDGTEENIHGDAGNDKLISGGEGHYYGDAGNDIIYAGLTAGVNEILDGGADVDTIDTTTWNGTYTINLVTGVTNFGESFINFENVVTGNGGDTITGTAGANNISTQAGIDTVDGAAGNDIIAGGADGDTLNGGADFDILSYRTSNGAVTINLATNTASGGHAAGDVISNFEGVWGSVLGDTLTGDTGNNELRGFEGIDSIAAGDGDDVVEGGGAGDTLDGGIGTDTLDYRNSSSGVTVSLLANTASGGDATGDVIANFENLLGSLSGDSLTGNAGVNVLDGGGGGDVLVGLGGDDRYYIRAAGDVIQEAAGAGNDTVYTGISYALTAGASVETLSTSLQVGTTAINLTGNALAQTIYGNAGVNVLDGGGGGDVLVGLGGDDRYYIRAAGDVIQEAAGAGNDTVYTGISYALTAGASVETLSTSLQVGTTAINLTGNALAQTIYGNAGVNVLDGGGGGDVLVGLGGDDRYYIRAAGDVIQEAAGAGNDTVYTGISYALTAGASVETLSTMLQVGTTAINLTGNALAQTIYGNAGVNVLDGGGGGDVLVGLGGDDRYYIRAAGDVIQEAAGAGNDTVYTGISYALTAGASVETLSTMLQVGTTAINLTGNALAQTIYGNAGANVLDGGGGGDVLVGLGGDDRYYIRAAGDVIQEAAGAGNDTVYTGISYALTAGASIETLSTMLQVGTTAINLTGNALAQTIYGNAGVNVLDGGGGGDVLVGLGGSDTFAFTTALGAGNVATISDYSVADDTIHLENAVFTGLAAGALAAGAFNTGAAATQADDRIIYNPVTGALLFDADGVGGAAGMQFATLAGGLALNASEFLVI